MRFCDKIVFQLHSTRNTLKVMQVKWSGGKPNIFKTKNLRPTLIISIRQTCEAIVRKYLI